MSKQPLLEVKDLVTEFRTDNGTVRAVDGVSFTLHRGETIGIVGESGSGKSVTSLSAMRLIPEPPGKIVNGKILFHAVDYASDLANLNEKQMRKFRGNEIAMIFQEPMTSLNPVFTCGKQVMEAIRLHQKSSRKEAKEKTIELFKKVKLPRPEDIFKSYPHQISGGQKQRVMIAMSLLCHPKLLIADEPTTALDVTVQAQIMQLLADIQKEFGMSIILITHDLGVVAGNSDEMLVMYGGEVMEIGKTEHLYSNATHPYTQGLMSAVPRLDDTADRLVTIPGNPPNMMLTPVGCPFSPRCKFANTTCSSQTPILTKVDNNDHYRACHVAIEDTL